MEFRACFQLHITIPNECFTSKAFSETWACSHQLHTILTLTMNAQSLHLLSQYRRVNSHSPRALPWWVFVQLTVLCHVKWKMKIDLFFPLFSAFVLTLRLSHFLCLFQRCETNVARYNEFILFDMKEQKWGVLKWETDQSSGFKCHEGKTKYWVHFIIIIFENEK